MTKQRRMLHAKISVSAQVNRLSVHARLLFTWMIAHADDEGRLKGESEYIKAAVVPMTTWSFKKIRVLTEEIKTQGLIYHWQVNDEWFIEFVKWNSHQYIQKDRRKASELPPYSKQIVRALDTNRTQTDDIVSPQAKVSEVKLIESKTSEIKSKENFPKTKRTWTNPKTFIPSTEKEVAALEAWNQLEHQNPMAFQVTYLTALEKGLPTSLFYQFVSEIKQDSTIKNAGAVFNKKVEAYLKGAV